jgi:hypothetical protein
MTYIFLSHVHKVFDVSFLKMDLEQITPMQMEIPKLVEGKWICEPKKDIKWCILLFGIEPLSSTSSSGRICLQKNLHGKISNS